MTLFGGYATFYDCLYQEKDYEAECDFIEQVWQRYASAPVRRVLDLGCGTGGHLLPLARRGYEVAGVDRSREMLEQARLKSLEAGVAFPLHLGDVQAIDLGQPFDAVISMFAVMSYQCRNVELLAAFQTAQRHLAAGGLFLFDVWFGPAVLNDPPVDRYKLIEQGDGRVLRFAHPEMELVTQIVTVYYRVLHLRGDRLVAEVQEQHPMRFFFPQELLHLLDTSGFDAVALCPFLVLDEVPTTHTWTVSVVARKR